MICVALKELFNSFIGESELNALNCLILSFKGEASL